LKTLLTEQSGALAKDAGGCVDISYHCLS